MTPKVKPLHTPISVTLDQTILGLELDHLKELEWLHQAASKETSFWIRSYMCLVIVDILKVLDSEKVDKLAEISLSLAQGKADALAKYYGIDLFTKLLLNFPHLRPKYMPVYETLINSLT